jgi:exonuclease SbcC
MKVLHAADLHARRESAEDFFLACESILQAAIKYEVSLIALSGDIWDGPTQNSAGSLFPDLIEPIRRFGDYAPVAMIYGTPSHDVEGSLEVFETMDCAHGIRILRPGMTYILKGGKIEELQGDNAEDAMLLVSGIPEPSKRWLVAGNTKHGSIEAGLQASEAFSTLCIATGCMRERYSQLPSLVLAHGQVEGAKTSQGLKLGTGDGIHFTKDSLKALHAEYIALGDIHQPQHIEGTRAWYAGSAYPLDFGETHKAGCWIVDIHEPGEPVDVERVEFPHPTRKHLICLASCAMEVPSIKGQQVWYEIKGTRNEVSMLDGDEILSRLYGHGAMEGSKVTFDLSQDEPVRAGEIRLKVGITEKLKTWAEATGETLTEGILEKARILERETAARNPVPANARYRIDRLILRGAIGLWARSRKDEIDLDLASHGSGVLALVGPNGAGKTTILENLHPWPRLLTRDSPIRDHFRLSDSFRDLYLTDQETGWKYRCLIRMRADIPSGSTEYWLFRDAGEGFEPLAGINRRLEPYEEWVGRLFGSLGLYQRTAFIGQKATRNCPDLSAATKGERKELFSELCGIDWLEAYHEAAKEHSDAVSREIEHIEARHSLLVGAQDRCAALHSEIERYAATADEKARAGRSLGIELGTAREKLSEALKAGQERARLMREREQAFNHVMALKGKQSGYTDQIETHRASLRLKSQMEERLATAQAISSRREALISQKEAFEKTERAALKDYSLAMADYTSRKEGLSTELGQVKVDLARVKESSLQVEERCSTPLGENCPTCGQILPKDELEHLHATRTADETLLAELNEKLRRLAHDREELELKIQNLHVPARPSQSEFPELDELEALGKELSSIDLADAYDVLRRADAAESTITHAKKELVRLEEEIGEASKIVEDCGASLGKLHSQDQEQEAKLEVERLESLLEDARLEQTRAQTRREETEKVLAEAKQQLQEYKDLSEKLKAMTFELCDWALLERAAGRDGIQALELDAIAPSISATASRLLAASGNEGSITIRTLRIAGKGSKQHAIEDFLILYVDASGEEQEISTLSGGESVWIRKAVYDAFEVIRAQSTGLQYCTVILDEADGALDPESRLRYLRMIEEAHKESGRYQTIMVTHSLELQAMADQCIDIKDLKPQPLPQKLDQPEDLAA